MSELTKPEIRRFGFRQGAPSAHGSFELLALDQGAYVRLFGVQCPLPCRCDTRDEALPSRPEQCGSSDQVAVAGCTQSQSDQRTPEVSLVDLPPRGQYGPSILLACHLVLSAQNQSETEIEWSRRFEGVEAAPVENRHGPSGEIARLGPISVDEGEVRQVREHGVLADQVTARSREEERLGQLVPSPTFLQDDGQRVGIATTPCRGDAFGVEPLGSGAVALRSRNPRAEIESSRRHAEVAEHLSLFDHSLDLFRRPARITGAEQDRAKLSRPDSDGIDLFLTRRAIRTPACQNM